jgi:hypothetical protein
MEKTVEQLQAEADALWEKYLEATRESAERFARWALANAEVIRALNGGKEMRKQ